jgi:hypothetical protein
VKRSAPLKRTGMRRVRARKEGPDVVQEQHPAALAPAVRRGTYAGTTTGPRPKETPAKPGKRTPTADERAWMNAIVAYGCIACRVEGFGYVRPAVHHILRGGLRIGHRFTLPLCDPGHHQNGAPLGLISRHPWKARFEDRYGDEWALLATLQGVLKKQADGSYAP